MDNKNKGSIDIALYHNTILLGALSQSKYSH